MYIVVYTDKNRVIDRYIDRFVLFDTAAEAQEAIDHLKSKPEVYCWALTKVMDASEPHWTDDDGWPKAKRPFTQDHMRPMDEILDEAFAAVFKEETS